MPENREGALFHWYVMHSKPQKEAWLYNQLSALDIESYYPSLRPSPENGNRRKPRPYFPGYIFVNVDLEITAVSALKWIPGAIGLVSFAGEPALVPDSLFQQIRNRVDEINRVRAELLDSLNPGDEVKVASGPFAGYEGILCSRLDGSSRAQVLLRILHDHAIRAHVRVDQLSVIKQARIRT